MECRDVPLRIQALLDRELDLAESDPLEDHLRSCPGCAQLLEREKRWREALDGRMREPVTAPQSLADLVRLRLDQIAGNEGVVVPRESPAPGPRNANLRAWLPLAAVALLALGFGLARVWPGANAAARPPQVAEAPKVVTPPRAAALPAGALPVHNVKVEGRLVCLYCEMEKCYGIHRACATGACRPAMVADDGRMITVLLPEAIDTAFDFHDHMDQRLDVTGTYFPAAQAVQVASFAYLPKSGA